MGQLARCRPVAAGDFGETAVPAMAFDWPQYVPLPRPEPWYRKRIAIASLPPPGYRSPRACVRSEAEAGDAAIALGLPVAMKGISPAVTHRAAAGLVALGIASVDEAGETYRLLSARAAAAGSSSTASMSSK